MKTKVAQLVASVAWFVSLALAGNPNSNTSKTSGGLDPRDSYLKAYPMGEFESNDFAKNADSTDGGGPTLGESVVAATETELSEPADFSDDMVTMSPQLKKKVGIDMGALDRKGGPLDWVQEPVEDSQDSALSESDGSETPRPTPAATFPTGKVHSSSDAGAATDAPSHDDSKATKGGPLDWVQEPVEDSQDSALSESDGSETPRPTPAATSRSPAHQSDDHSNNQQPTQSPQWDQQPNNQQPTQAPQWDQQPNNQQTPPVSNNEHSQGPQPAQSDQNSHWQGVWGTSPSSGSQNHWAGGWGAATQTPSSPTPAPTKASDPSRKLNQSPPAETVVLSSAPPVSAPSPLMSKCAVHRSRY
uniref:Uncharacterized protein n=1 Tax=Peronospora matthiolae TaxID=2874970 RepID=A0AAV1UCI8_9STRA